MVILEFQQPDDSLKLEAAYHLIKNFETNYTVQYSLVDSNNNEVIFDVNKFDSYRSVLNEKKRLEKKFGKLHYKADTIILDIDFMSSLQLIKHINNKMESWNMSDNGYYNKTEFMDYILPYRVANEWPEDLPDELEEEIDILKTSIDNKKVLADTINRLINSWFTIDNGYSIYPSSRKIAEIISLGKGSPMEINILKVNALRSVGIAAALDYTPYFNDSLSGYYTTTVFNPDGSIINYGTSKYDSVLFDNPKVAKVYRRTYTCDDNCLFKLKEVSDFTPPYMGNYCFEDVTSDYRKTKDTTLHFPSQYEYVYLGIINDGELKAIDWSVNIEGEATFRNLGLGIDYTPIIVKNKELVKIGDSFSLK